MIVGAVLLIDLEGGGEHGVEAVHTHAALEAGRGLLSQQPLHTNLVHQVLGGLMQVGETVDGMPGEAGLDGHQLGILGVLCQGVGHGDAVDRGPDHGMVHPILDLLAEHIYSGLEFPQAFNILLRGH